MPTRRLWPFAAQPQRSPLARRPGDRAEGRAAKRQGSKLLPEATKATTLLTIRYCRSSSTACTLRCVEPTNRPQLPDYNAPHIDRLVELLRKEAVALLVGAGTSMACGYPGWAAFLEALEKPLLKKLSLNYIAQLRERDVRARADELATFLGGEFGVIFLLRLPPARRRHRSGSACCSSLGAASFSPPIIRLNWSMHLPLTL